MESDLFRYVGAMESSHSSLDPSMYDRAMKKKHGVM